MEESSLEKMMVRHQDELEKAIEETEAELAALDERREELMRQIRRAQELLEGVTRPPSPPATSDITLHEAMLLVLEENPNGMRGVDLTNEINRRQLYTMRDGSPVEMQQVHARANHYEHLFVKRDGLFFKREQPGD